MDAIVINSAGCGSAMKEYGTFFARAADGQPGPMASRAAAFSGRVRDFSEFLAELYRDHGGPRAVRHELKAITAYHDACHLAHAQGIKQQPRDLLDGIPGLDLIEVGGGGTCCGSAGIYNLVQPEAAAELGQRKAAASGRPGRAWSCPPTPAAACRSPLPWPPTAAIGCSRRTSPRCSTPRSVGCRCPPWMSAPPSNLPLSAPDAGQQPPFARAPRGRATSLCPRVRGPPRREP